MIRYVITNHNYNKILKSDWLSTALISALIGQLNRTTRHAFKIQRRDGHENVN